MEFFIIYLIGVMISMLIEVIHYYIKFNSLNYGELTGLFLTSLSWPIVVVVVIFGLTITIVLQIISIIGYLIKWYNKKAS